MNPKFKGLVFGIIAAIAYGTNPLFSLPLYAEGMTPDSVLFYRFGIGSLLLGVILFTFQQFSIYECGYSINHTFRLSGIGSYYYGCFL